MTWRTGTKNPHTLYYDEGATSIPHGFLMNPEVAKRIVTAMNEIDGLRDTATSNQRDNVELVTERAMAKALIQGLVEERDAAEARLVAAAELLTEIAARVEIPWALHGNLISRMRAFLANQPRRVLKP